MKPRTSVEELHAALVQLEELAKSSKALDPEFKRGYLHAIGMVRRWCTGERGTPVPENTEAEAKKVLDGFRGLFGDLPFFNLSKN